MCAINLKIQLLINVILNNLLNNKSLACNQAFNFTNIDMNTNRIEMMRFITNKTHQQSYHINISFFKQQLNLNDMKNQSNKLNFDSKIKKNFCTSEIYKINYLDEVTYD